MSERCVGMSKENTKEISHELFEWLCDYFINGCTELGGSRCDKGWYREVDGCCQMREDCEFYLFGSDLSKELER